MSIFAEQFACGQCTAAVEQLIARQDLNSWQTQKRHPVLVVFSGLPGMGKTTIASALAARMNALYLRIDTIEHAMKAAGAERIGPAGYAVANALAETNLRLGHAVVADCVNPVRESRLGWRQVAAQSGAACSTG